MLRNHAEIIEYLIAKKTDQPTYKGTSILFRIPELDIVANVSGVIDSMHCLWEGVMKLLCTLWFNANYSQEKWSIHQHVSRCSEIMQNQKPPHDFSHPFRS